MVPSGELKSTLFMVQDLADSHSGVARTLPLFLPFLSLCVRPSVSQERSSNLAKDECFHSNHPLFQDIFKMLSASAAWDWWASDVCPGDRICPWRRVIISPDMKVEGPHLFVLFQESLPGSPVTTCSDVS